MKVHVYGTILNGLRQLGAQFWRLRPEKKRYSRLSLVAILIFMGERRVCGVCVCTRVGVNAMEKKP